MQSFYKFFSLCILYTEYESTKCYIFSSVALKLFTPCFSVHLIQCQFYLVFKYLKNRDLFTMLNIYYLKPFHQSHGALKQQMLTVYEFIIRVQFFNFLPLLKDMVDKRIKINEEQFFWSKLMLQVSESGKLKTKLLRLPKSKVLTLEFLFYSIVFLINVTLQFVGKSAGFLLLF